MKLPRRRFLHLVAGTAAVPTATVLGQGTTTPTGAIGIVERTHYYAKPGLAAEVLDVRRKASAVRLSIGLEDPIDLTDDLAQALAASQKA